MSNYQRIVYPERAEYLQNESAFKAYRVFLDHWMDITEYLRQGFEIQRVRRHSKGLIIAGKQGCGKSVLARKIFADFERTRASLNGVVQYDQENIWHRITAGTNPEKHEVNLRGATQGSVFLHIEDDRNWIEQATAMLQNNTDRSAIVIADNCEREYFLKSLLNVSDEAYLQTGRTETAIRSAAQRFVALCRGPLRGCLFVFFTNDEDFALAFEIEVNKQHNGLLETRELNMPKGSEKEAIVRINVNRLNPYSYWLCIDRSGPDEKCAVWRALNGAETFPAAFQAVDNAVQSSTRNRAGRPARTCVLNAVVLSNQPTGSCTFNNDANIGIYEDLYSGDNARVRLYSDWHALFGGTRELRMLSSEWQLKVIILSDAFVSALLAGSTLAKDLLDLLTTYLGPGIHNTTKTKHNSAIEVADKAITTAYPEPDNQIFWGKGAPRSHDYEAQLKGFYPSYNTKSGGLKSARPDLVISDFIPSSVLASATADPTAINAAIKREANMVEFTAIKDFTFAKLQKYISEQKISNYVQATQEQ